MRHTLPALAGLILAFGATAQTGEELEVIELPAPEDERMRDVPAEFEGRFEAEVIAEGRWFYQDPQWPGQEDGGLSVAIEPEFYGVWNQGEMSLLFTPFARLDSMDSERTHADIRELYFERVWDRIELRAGISRVFWGKTELLHLVDVINQDDGVENLDGEDKLGQPMLRLNWITGAGQLHAYLLPLFRERTFAGEDGRLRAPLEVDQDRPFYESSDLEEHVDWALRYQGYYRALDYGVAFFEGTNRDPQLVPGPRSDGQGIELIPFYALMRQWSVDAQLTVGGWLWKFEALNRQTGQVETDQAFNYTLRDLDYWAMTGGFEYTFYGINQSAVDAGLLVEYLYDDRGESGDSAFQNDVFVGTRLAANDVRDSTLLGGFVLDLDNDGLFFNIEASRRLSGNSKLSLELRAFTNIDVNDPLSSVRADDLVQIEYAYFW